MNDERSKGKIGQMVEYKAIAWLLNQGLEVFKNVTYHGPVDIITLDRETGEVTKIDVKKVVDGSRHSVKVSRPGRSDIQRTLNVRLLFFNEKNDQFAWTIADIYGEMGREKQERKIQPIRVDITEYPSIAACARAFDVNERTLANRLRTHPNVPVAETIAYIKCHQKPVVVGNETYVSKKDACEKLGVDLRVVEYWHYEKGMLFEEAINEALRRQKNA